MTSTEALPPPPAGRPRWRIAEVALDGKRMKVLIKSAWGSADPTEASFPFHHANAFAEAGHEVQIFRLGEAVSLMRAVVAGSVVPVGWAPLADALAKTVGHRVPIHV